MLNFEELKQLNDRSRSLNGPMKAIFIKSVDGEGAPYITYRTVNAKSKGYEVSVGRIGKLECDFILRRNNSDYSYIQVAMTIMNDLETENREYRPFENIRDNYPKYLVTRNDLIQHRGGIIHVNLPQFMKDNRMF